MENFRVYVVPLLLVVFLFFPPVTREGKSGETRFMAIAWHDVVDGREDLASDAVTTDHLVDQFEWLLSNGYHPVSIDQLLAARRGEKALPEKPVLLCWDDGYVSFYTRVFPLLQSYRFPAVLALVGSWLEPEPPATVLYGDNKVSREKFLNWKQLRELADSGLVEIASHSYNLHRGILADKAGDRLPAVVAHAYNPKQDSYESDEELRQRILADLRRNNQLIANRIGHAPRVLVWPFGRYNEAALDAAQEAGLSITLTLDPVPGDIADLRAVGRLYPTQNPGLDEFRGYLNLDRPMSVRRFFKVDSRELIDEPGRETRFGRLLDRLVDVQPDMVTFEPIFEENGRVVALFPNTRFPEYRDRLTRLTWHTARRGGSGTFLWLKGKLFSGDQGNTDTFFRQMGQFAFPEGLLVDYPELVDEFLKASLGQYPSADRVLSWDPSRRRKARQRWNPTRFPVISQCFSLLESFQYWQPFVETGLVIDADLLPELSRERIRFLLTWFDMLLLDARNHPELDAEAVERLEELQAGGMLPRISMLFSYDGNDQRLTGKLAELPRFNIINWGYDGDRFMERRPASSLIRPLMSRSTYPFR